MPYADGGGRSFALRSMPAGLRRSGRRQGAGLAANGLSDPTDLALGLNAQARHHRHPGLRHASLAETLTPEAGSCTLSCLWICADMLADCARSSFAGRALNHAPRQVRTIGAKLIAVFVRQDIDRVFEQRFLHSPLNRLARAVQKKQNLCQANDCRKLQNTNDRTQHRDCRC
jgi:hypothetical protein